MEDIYNPSFGFPHTLKPVTPKITFRRVNEWDPAKKFKMPKFTSEDPWECPLCDKMIPFEETHIQNCSFLTLENKITDVSN